MPDTSRATAGSRRVREYCKNESSVKFPKTSPDPDVWRAQPREPFDAPFNPDRPPGTKGLGISSTDDPALIYLKLLSDSLEIMLEETNRHAQERYDSGKIKYKMRPTDRPEMLKFLAVMMAQGSTLKKDYQNHWKDQGLNETSNYKKVIPLKRFKQILQNLHFVNSEEAARLGWDDKEDGNYDTIHKINEFLESAYAKFREARAPGKELSFDEQMVRFHGRFAFVCIMPCKPIRKGIKLYVLTDAKTGYTLSIVIHAGNYGSDTASETFDKVWTGLVKANVFDQGFHMFTDSYYTSRRLAEELLERDIYLIGTMKKQMSEGLPPVVSDRYSKFSTSMNRGEAVFLHTSKLTMCNWSDSANVILLSAHPTIINQWTTCKRRNKKPKPGEPVVQEWTQPLIFHCYNENMGGVDLQGQLVKNSSRPYRSLKWVSTNMHTVANSVNKESAFSQASSFLAHHVLDAGVTNTYVIMKDGILPASNERLTVKDTRDLIVTGLLKLAHVLGQSIPPSLLPPETPTTGKRGLKRPLEMSSQLRHDTTQPHLAIRAKRNTCKGHLQPKWCSMKCSTCNVSLCIDCFARYHLEWDEKFDDVKKHKK